MFSTLSGISNLVILLFTNASAWISVKPITSTPSGIITFVISLLLNTLLPISLTASLLIFEGIFISLPQIVSYLVILPFSTSKQDSFVKAIFVFLLHYYTFFH